MPTALGLLKETTMAQRHQRGWLKKERRAQGETWVLFFRTTRKCDGELVENRDVLDERVWNRIAAAMGL